MPCGYLSYEVLIEHLLLLGFPASRWEGRLLFLLMIFLHLLLLLLPQGVVVVQHAVRFQITSLICIIN
jgi:hypothetical protein